MCALMCALSLIPTFSRQREKEPIEQAAADSSLSRGGRGLG